MPIPNLADLFALYDRFLSWFPTDWHGPIALGLVLALAGAFWHVLKKSGPWLLLLVVLVPASLPILRGAVLNLIELLKFLISRASAAS